MSDKLKNQIESQEREIVRLKSKLKFSTKKEKEAKNELNNLHQYINNVHNEQSN